MTNPTPDWRPSLRGRVRAHRLAQAAAAVYVQPPGAYAVENYLMPNGAVLQSRWYERTDDVTLAILPRGGAA